MTGESTSLFWDCLPTRRPSTGLPPGGRLYTSRVDLADYDYALPPGAIAQAPPPSRKDAR
jgi:hypothetical protein